MVIFILDALILQIVLFCMSFPILVSWGIMWSPLVFAGTLLMGPFLSVFLALSALIFITELCFVPNGVLITLLELCTQAWLWCMDRVPILPKIGYPEGPLAVMCMLPLGAFLLVWLLARASRPVRLAALLIWTGCFLGLYGWYFKPKDQTFRVPLGRNQLECRVAQGRITLVDTQGALASRACTPGWVQYTLRPLLVRKTGRGSVDEIA